MKTSVRLALLFLAATSIASAQRLTVHEWGTFTTVQGSDGKLLPGLYLEEEHLPKFVHHHGGFSPDGTTQKGIYKPALNVTVKMETPVLYFYSQEARDVSVRVGFKGGSISQWYPQRTAGEPDDTSVIDFGRGYDGWISWDTHVLPQGSKERLSPPELDLTPTWTAPRATDANLIRSNGEVEKYLFYRGIGNLAVPLAASYDAAGDLIVRNTGAEAIPYVFVYDKPETGPARVYWTGRLEGGEARSVTTPATFTGTADITASFEEFEDALVEAGLYRREAAAMLDTWHVSYFERPGLRVFWVVPRSFTDQILPISITPAPDELERVLVGRSEVLSPAFEQKLLATFNESQGDAWRHDRYYLAYQDRVEAMRAASGTSSVPTEDATADRTFRIWMDQGERQCNVTAELREGLPVTVALTNLLGEPVMALDATTDGEVFHRVLDLSSLTSGVYFVTLRADGVNRTRKVVVE